MLPCGKFCLKAFPRTHITDKGYALIIVDTKSDFKISYILHQLKTYTNRKRFANKECTTDA